MMSPVSQPLTVQLEVRITEKKRSAMPRPKFVQIEQVSEKA